MTAKKNGCRLPEAASLWGVNWIVPGARLMPGLETITLCPAPRFRNGGTRIMAIAGSALLVLTRVTESPSPVGSQACARA